jgi:hypothetical protein
MSYPPQPGPYGSPRPDPNRPPDLFTPQQSSYQGLGTYSNDPGEPAPPRRRSTAKIVAVVVIALLVLGGGGAGVYYFLTKGDDKDTGATEDRPDQPRPNDSNGSGPIDDKPAEQQNGGSTDPAGVQQAYIEAYESKRFSDVVNSACEAYKKRFGTNTTDLETKLAPYDIKASADGTPTVSGGTATANIDLELTKNGETKTPKIKIKIVKESGKWKFCGEGES